MNYFANLCTEVLGCSFIPWMHPNLLLLHFICCMGVIVGQTGKLLLNIEVVFHQFIFDFIIMTKKA